MLELLEKKKMDETLLIVVRYFGGVLLGASRLMSTYLETGVQVLNSADIVEIANKHVYKMTITYSEFDELQRLGRMWGFSFENIQYGDKINVDVLGNEEDGQKLVDAFPHSAIDVSGTRKIYRR